VTESKPVIIDHHPGRSSQTIGIARELGTDPDLIHEPSVGVVGTKGDSQCYMGVMAKDRDGNPVFLAKSAWEVNYIAERYAKIRFAATRER